MTRTLDNIIVPAAHRQFKDGLYAQFARIGHAVSSPKRIELLDVLAQAERAVADLAELTATPIKNTSSHLRTLRQAGLVDTRKEGQFVYYRLADVEVHELLRRLQTIAQARFGEVERMKRLYLDDRDELEAVSVRDLERRLRDGAVTLIDVRPIEEFEAGHIPGALSVPIDRLRRGTVDLPRSREVVAYCRGRYCVYAVDAVTLLRKRGYRARRLEEGFPAWRGRGRRIVASGTQ